jgi:hypothetical protein
VEVQKRKFAHDSAFGERESEPVGPSWKRLLSAYPAITRGPATFLRQFDVWQVVERDGWKHRKLYRIERSEYRGATIAVEAHRIPINTRPAKLGTLVLEPT